MWLFMQEHLACLERGNVGFGLSEDSIKRFIVGEAVCDRGTCMLNFPVGPNAQNCIVGVNLA